MIFLDGGEFDGIDLHSALIRLPNRSMVIDWFAFVLHSFLRSGATGDARSRSHPIVFAVLPGNTSACELEGRS